MTRLVLNMVWFIQALIITICSVLILFTPSFIYMVAGGTSTDVEFLCRGIGFLIWLAILMRITK